MFTCFARCLKKTMFANCSAHLFRLLVWFFVLNPALVSMHLSAKSLYMGSVRHPLFVVRHNSTARIRTSRTPPRTDDMISGRVWRTVRDSCSSTTRRLSNNPGWPYRRVKSRAADTEDIVYIFRLTAGTVSFYSHSNAAEPVPCSFDSWSQRRVPPRKPTPKPSHLRCASRDLNAGRVRPRLFPQRTHTRVKI